MRKHYTCPKCAARHTTDAWDYRTRMELGIEDIDSEDILSLDSMGYILQNNVQNEYACPTCGNFTLGLEIGSFDEEVIKKTEHELTNLLLNLKLQDDFMIGLDSVSNDIEQLWVKYTDDGWHVQYSNDPADSDTFIIIEEAVNSILKLGVVKLS